MDIAFEDITKEDFEDYENVRQSGLVNMFSPQARELAGLNRATHLAIIQNYEKLMAKWPDVRK